MKLRHQKMSAEFEKWLFVYRGEGKKYFHFVTHHFTGKDKGYPHNHPWNFTTYILAGGYVEKEYKIHEDGTWSSEIIHRQAGSVHNVTTNTIHEIIELPQGECWTAVVPTSPVPTPWHFWRFDESGIYKRLPRERRFRKL